MKRLGVHLLVVILLAVQARAVPLSSFFSYERDNVLSRRLTASTPVQLANTFRYNGQDFTSIYVSQCRMHVDFIACPDPSKHNALHIQVYIQYVDFD